MQCNHQLHSELPKRKCIFQPIFAARLTIDSVLELTFGPRAVEAAFRFGDQSVVVDLPKVRSR